MFDNLRGFIDKIKPNFVKGGKFGWLQSTFEAFETFAFTPNTVTARGSHVRDAVDMKRAMKRNMRSPGLYARLASGMYLLSPGGFYFLIGQMNQHRHHERRANGFTS